MSEFACELEITPTEPENYERQDTNAQGSSEVMTTQK